ncbi:MAG TPA: alpha/beta hydrolase [Clostridia bacterium]|nr:alpha/beta hydrolase [Clostridia bacterium]
MTQAADQLAWDKTFPQSDKVIHQKVSFNNRLGINLVADLYIPKNLDQSKKHAAIVVGGPYGAVKEQSAGLYAQTMAERGFVTIAHDPSYNGESGGQPHFTASFEALIEDFSAAVDFLGTKSYVDRERIGVIGVCGGGSLGLAAAETDPRIKAVATVSMYDRTSRRFRNNVGLKWMARRAPWPSERRRSSRRRRRTSIKSFMTTTAYHGANTRVHQRLFGGRVPLR